MRPFEERLLPVNLPPVTDAQDSDRPALDLKDDPPVTDAQLPIAFQGVPERSSEFMRKKGELLLDCAADPLPFSRGDAGQVFLRNVRVVKNFERRLHAGLLRHTFQTSP